MRFVLPGDKIGLAEEYAKGDGVYEENGELFAAVAGHLIIENRVASVKSLKEIPEVRQGDVVLGRVIDVRNNIALVEVVRKKGEARALTRKSVGLLHVSNVGVESISRAVSYLDIVKAKVIDDSLRLSLKEEGMGVIKAICSLCRQEMFRESDTLKCPECGNVEKRKLSPDYGRGEW